jgi:transposase InsO family protein
MHSVFQDLLHVAVLIWIDDVILFAADAASYLQRLHQFLETLRVHNLKLNARKCTVFSREVVWCGRVISGQGIAHDPSRLAALRELQLPPTAADLQHFVCAMNWLHDSIVDFARLVEPLREKLEAVMAVRGRRKAQLRGALLTWSDDEILAFQTVLTATERVQQRHFADPDAIVCVFTDASKTGWAMVVTQVRAWATNVAVQDQQHELLICKGGMFRKAQANWSVIEKEAYPIVKACSELEYLLDRDGGFRIYCDHANLIQVFAPGTEVKQHIKGKLQRWVLKMSAYRYTITHIPGEHNLWADMVSRWGQAGNENTSQVQVRRVTTRSVAEPSILRPLQDSEFVWPTKEDVVRAQRQFQRDVPATAVDRDGVLCIGDKMWVPGKARELIQRLLVVGHCGTEGHRGMSVMIEHMARRFSFDGLRTSVQRFVAECLLCKHVKGGRLIQRDWTVERGNTERNGCLHIDYLYLGDSYGAAKYVLVLKDELTHYCELVAADSADGLTAADAVLDWYKRFGLPREWVSDNGSHFKNHLLEELTRRLRVEHTFVPVYTPWINGTVERVNRDILQVLRVLLMELRLDTRNWVHLLPLIQANLNHSPVASLDGLAPIELFTGLSAGSALDAVVIPSERLPRHVPEDTAELQESLAALRTSLEGMHERVNKLREQRRDANMRRSSGLTCNFSEGDYVLWSRIDKRIRGNKLLARWIGPFRVLKALPHSFIIQHLISGDEFDVHGSRLKFYCDAELNVSVEVREHVAAQGIVLGVRGISRHRRNAESNEWELLVSWQGLQDVENSWEPFDSMLADVPALVRQYVMEKNVTDLQQFL